MGGWGGEGDEGDEGDGEFAYGGEVGASTFNEGLGGKVTVNGLESIEVSGSGIGDTGLGNSNILGLTHHTYVLYEIWAFEPYLTPNTVNIRLNKGCVQCLKRSFCVTHIISNLYSA